MCQYHECQQQVHAEVLHHQKEIVVETFASEEFKRSEKGMTTIQCRDRQHVDKPQGNGEEGCEQPETLPVPCIGENIANTDEDRERVLKNAVSLYKDICDGVQCKVPDDRYFV